MLCNIPKSILIAKRTAKELVLPDTMEVMLHSMHAIPKTLGLFTLSLSNPAKMPAIEYVIVKAAPDSKP